MDQATFEEKLDQLAHLAAEADRATGTTFNGTMIASILDTALGVKAHGGGMKDFAAALTPEQREWFGEERITSMLEGT